jgi:hypothetical protein
MAVVDNAEREVVVEFGVPLSRVSLGLHPLINWTGNGNVLTELRWECRGWTEGRACQ